MSIDTPMEVATTKVNIYCIDAFTLRTDYAKSKHELFQFICSAEFLTCANPRHAHNEHWDPPVLAFTHWNMSA
jgi:hypothetical protein